MWRILRVNEEGKKNENNNDDKRVKRHNDSITIMVILSEIEKQLQQASGRMKETERGKNNTHMNSKSELVEGWAKQSGVYVCVRAQNENNNNKNWRSKQQRKK